MKEQNLSKKTSFIKKIFIKICRLLGYEIIDQGNFFVPTQNKFINELVKKKLFYPLAVILLEIWSTHNNFKIWIDLQLY